MMADPLLALPPGPKPVPEHIVGDPPHHRHTQEVCASCGVGWVVMEDGRTLVMTHNPRCAYIAALEAMD